MTKTFRTFASNSIINENFTEVPNLATTYFNCSSNMNRTYQVNNSTNTRTHNGNTNTHINEEESRKPQLNRLIGVIFLIILVIISLAFLTFAIFYDEIIDDDDAGKFHPPLQSIQNTSQFNQTLENGTQIIIITENYSKENDTTIEEENNNNNKTILKQSITFENFIYGELRPKKFEGEWISTNELLHYDSANNLCITNVTDFNTTIIIPSETIRLYHISGLSLSADRKYLLVPYILRQVFRYTTIAKYRIFSINDRELYPSISTPNNPRETSLNYAEWGPIGSQIIFIYKNNMFYKRDVKAEPIRLTKTGREYLIYNGVPDWVYEEEIIGGPKTFWISPDGNQLVYATINDSMVDIVTWPFFGAYRQNDSNFSLHTKLVTIRYPKPGHRNPTIRMNYLPLRDIIESNTSNEFEFIKNKTIDLQPPKDITILGDYYFTTFKWIDSDNFAINWMTRAQNLSVMTVYSISANLEPISNYKLESNNSWIDFQPPLVTTDNNSYIILMPKMSDNNKDYFKHIAKVSFKSNETEYLTSGVFEVNDILDINPEIDRIYFRASYPSNPGAVHLLSVPLNQTLRVEPICHTCSINANTTDDKICLVSQTKFSIKAEYYILECEGPNIPRIEIRKTIDDSLVYVLEDNKVLANKLQNLSLPKRILMKVPIGNYDIDVMLIVPQDFDEKSTKKYPLIFNVYGGPGSHSASVSYSYFYNEFSAFMAANKSVIYGLVDTRGSPNHGCQFMFDIYHKFGNVEVEDTIGVARYFRDNVSYVDRNAISIWGWSYGGYLTTMSLMNDYNDTVFKCGIAVAPVTDWMFYDSVYTEKFMGFPTPEDNLKNYLKSSTLDKVRHLNGKQFLIIFGTADDNVHMQNSMLLIKALNEANIKYETQVYPDNNHNLPYSQYHMYKRMVNFFDRCFAKKVS